MSETLSLESLYDRYLKFLAIPQRSRIASGFKVVTKDDFARFYSVSIADLASLEDRPDFSKRFSDARKEWARTKTPELLEILYDKYKRTQSTQDLKLWLELTGEISNKPEAMTTNNIVNLFNISDDQKKSIIQRLNRRLSHGA